MNNPPLETLEQQKLFQWLRVKNIFSFSIPNGSILKGNQVQRAIQMRKLKAEGLEVGASDVVVMLKDKILFIEMKRQPKTLKSGKKSYANSIVSPDQKAFIMNVDKFEYARAFVCYGAEDAIKVIEREMR